MESLIESGVWSSKRQKCSCDGGIASIAMITVDRISDLPEDIICNILSLMPRKSAVATSLLSKRWRCVWTNVNSFDFDLDEKATKHKNWRTSFHLVEKVLMHQRSETMAKVRLKWRNQRDCQRDYVSTFISIAIARSVKVLDLHTYSGDLHDSAVHIPSYLFTSKTLENLRPNGAFLFNFPTDTVYLPKLGILDLKGVVYECFRG